MMMRNYDDAQLSIQIAIFFFDFRAGDRRAWNFYQWFVYSLPTVELCFSQIKTYVQGKIFL